MSRGRFNIGNYYHPIELPVHVTSVINEGIVEVDVHADEKLANEDVYQDNYIRVRNGTGALTTVNIRLDEFFPEGEVWTLYRGADKAFAGIFRTKEQAMEARQWLKKNGVDDWQKWWPNRIDIDLGNVE